MIKRILSLTLLMAASLFAQDIPITQAPPYLTLGRGLIIGQSGPAGLINTWVIKTESANGVCVSLRNNDVTTRTIGYSVFTTLDPSVTDYTNNSTKWSSASGVTPTVFIVASGTTVQTYFGTGGAAQVAIQISAVGLSGVTGTADLLVTQSAFPCGQSAPPINCNHGATVTVATGTSAQLLAGVNGQSIYVCKLSISFSGAPAAVANAVQIRYTTIDCTAGQTTVWRLDSTATTPTFLDTGSNQSAFIFAPGSGIPGSPLCVTTGATTVNQTFNFSYAQF